MCMIHTHANYVFQEYTSMLWQVITVYEKLSLFADRIFQQGDKHSLAFYLLISTMHKLVSASYCEHEEDDAGPKGAGSS